MEEVMTRGTEEVRKGGGRKEGRKEGGRKEGRAT